MRKAMTRLGTLLAAVGVVYVAVEAQQRGAGPVTSEQLLAGTTNPSHWLMFAGDYSGRRHSPLTQVTPQNVNRLVHEWTFQTATLGAFETTPLVHDGVIYATGANNHAWALDARTGRSFWRYRRELPADHPTVKTSPGLGTGSGRRTSASAKLKMAQLAPMPMASDSTATVVNPGLAASIRNP